MKLKKALFQYLVLLDPDFPREFVVQTDASSEGLGAVLSQEVNGEEPHSLSRKLTATKKNYVSVVE